MGYACPVCSDPQADAGHLANHLAFTAMLGDDDHEAWLDRHASGWDGMGESELATVVADLVEETEFPQLFEDTVGGLEEGSDEPLEERSGALFDDEHDHQRGHHHGGHGHPGHDHDHAHPREQGSNHRGGDRHDPSGAIDTAGPMDDETAEVLEEAREMTRQMREAPDDERESRDEANGADEANGTAADRDDAGGDDRGE